MTKEKKDYGKLLKDAFDKGHRREIVDIIAKMNKSEIEKLPIEMRHLIENAFSKSVRSLNSAPDYEEVSEAQQLYSQQLGIMQSIPDDSVYISPFNNDPKKIEQTKWGYRGK